MTADLSNLNPLAAPAQKQLARRNYVRCTKNAIEDMPLTLKSKSGVAADTYVPFWTIEYECLDVQWNDGGKFITSFGSRLIDKNGAQLDATQRPAVCAQAFAAFDIIAFPADPNYNEADIVGRSFVMEATEFPTGRPVPLPIEDLGFGFVYTGEVRSITPKNSGEADVAVAAGGAPISVDVAADPALLEKLKTAVASVDFTNEEAVVGAIRDANLGRGLTFDGKSLLSLALDGQLPAALGLTG